MWFQSQPGLYSEERQREGEKEGKRGRWERKTQVEEGQRNQGIVLPQFWPELTHFLYQLLSASVLVKWPVTALSSVSFGKPSGKSPFPSSRWFFGKGPYTCSQSTVWALPSQLLELTAHETHLTGNFWLLYLVCLPCLHSTNGIAVH